MKNGQSMMVFYFIKELMSNLFCFFESYPGLILIIYNNIPAYNYTQQHHMQQQIYQTLEQTITSNTQIVHQASETLQLLSLESGFCVTLMQITNHPQISYQIRLAALVQLKNLIKKRWNPNSQYTLTALQKAQVRNNLIEATIRCGKNHTLVKLYREIITTVVKFEYQDWLGTDEIKLALQNRDLIPVAMHCLLGVCAHFKYSAADKQKTIYSNFLSQFLPLVYELLKQNQNNIEIIYLGVKFLWKAILYDMSVKVKCMFNVWMELLYVIVASKGQGMRTEGIQKYSVEFYYHQSKKWATRILFRFIQSITRTTIFGTTFSPENTEYCHQWHQTYGEKFLIAVYNQLAVPATVKVRYFQLRTLQSWINQNPTATLQFGEHCLFSLLLEYLSAKPKDQLIVENEPIQYFREQEDSSFMNLKRAATDVWISYLEVGAVIDRKTNAYTSGPFLPKAIQYLIQNLTNGNALHKEMAMYLLSNRKTKQVLCRSLDFKEKICPIIISAVILELSSQQVLIRVRACQILDQYSRQGIKKENIQSITEGVLKCLQQPVILVQIKSAIVVGKLLMYAPARSMICPYLKDILQIYLKLIQKYDIEQLVSSLELLIKHFNQQIGPFAVELFSYLESLFQAAYQRDSEEQKINGQAELAAVGILGTMSQLAQVPLGHDIINLEPQLMKVCHFLLHLKCYDYAQELMFLIKTYLSNVDHISSNLCGLFEKMVYFIVGVPSHLANQLENADQNRSDVEFQVLSRLKRYRETNIEFMESALQMFRLFLLKAIPQMLLQNNLSFHEKFMEIFFYLIRQTFNKTKSFKLSESLTPIYCSMTLLIYFIEYAPAVLILSSPLYFYHIFGVLEQSCLFQSIYLKAINTQLIGVCIWKLSDQFLLEYLKRKGMPELLKQLNIGYHKLVEYQQQRRTALGLSVLLTKWQYFSEGDLSQILETFNTLLRLIEKCCKCIKKFYNKKTNIKEIYDEDMKGDENSDIYQQFLDGSDEDSEGYDLDDDFWNENLDIEPKQWAGMEDQIELFKSAMGFIEKENNNFYKSLVGSVSEQKVKKVGSMMEESRAMKKELLEM